MVMAKRKVIWTKRATHPFNVPIEYVRQESEQNADKLKRKILDTINELTEGAFEFVAGWWGHQPGRRAVGGVPPPTISLAVQQIEMHP